MFRPSKMRGEYFPMVYNTVTPILINLLCPILVLFSAFLPFSFFSLIKIRVLFSVQCMERSVLLLDISSNRIIFPCSERPIHLNWCHILSLFLFPFFFFFLSFICYFYSEMKVRPQNWNSLPQNIQSAVNTDQFKKLLKTHLFQK